MRPIGVLLSCMPRVLCDVLSDVINDQADMAVLSDCVDVDALLAEIHSRQPDVIVVGLAGAKLAAMCERVLRQTPGLRIVAVEDEGRSASLVELRPTRTPVSEPSVEGFLDLIRVAAEGDRRGNWRSAPSGAAQARRPRR